MNTGAPLDERYFPWLYEMIGVIQNPNPARSYWQLAKVLFEKEFLFFIPNDDNRADEGRSLREEFLDQSPFNERRAASEWLSLPCSMLEMLISLARRAAFESSDDREGSVGDWFWLMMVNVGLDKYTDAVWNPTRARRANNILEVVIHRRYDEDGRGGLFPLVYPQTNQRTTELWYQLQQYLQENSEEALLS